jgi:CheY-like chemotaxis protein
MRILICEDNRFLQTTLTELVTGQGHTVLAVTDNTFDGAQLAQRFWPDAVLLDLELETGLGRQTLCDLDVPERKFPLVVLTSYPRDLHPDIAAVTVVDKADMGALRAALVRLADGHEETHERRNANARVDPPPRTADFVDDPAPLFFAALDQAQADDALVVVRPPDGAELDALTKTCRKMIRDQDFLLRQPASVVILLFGGAEAAAAAVAARVIAAADDAGLVVTQAVITETEAPADAFLRATRGG